MEYLLEFRTKIAVGICQCDEYLPVRYLGIVDAVSVSGQVCGNQKRDDRRENRTQHRELINYDACWP